MRIIKEMGVKAEIEKVREIRMVVGTRKAEEEISEDRYFCRLAKYNITCVTKKIYIFISTLIII